MQKPIFSLTKAAIRRQSTAQSYERGRDYYLSGTVLQVIRRGDQIVAQVMGSYYDPYTVAIDFDRGGLTDVTCDCPYDWGGWCKHIIATLLVCLHEPGRIEERPTIVDLLADLDRAQLHTVLMGLVESDAGLIDHVEREVALVKGAAEPSLQRETIDQVSIRRQVYAILHSLDHMRRSEAYWHVARVVDQVRQMLMRVHDWIADREIRTAFAFLEAITEAYIVDWEILDDSGGDPSGFFLDLGNAWEKAVLAADLSPAERKEWIKIADWQEQLHGYELDEAFELARMELEEKEDEP
jgi:uncharacterized Zn finger protein